MNYTLEKICRLCLRAADNDFKLIEEATRGILDFIQLRIELSITHEPIICKECEVNLWQSHDFKSSCMHAEDFIASVTSIRDDGVLDLRDVSLSENKREDIGSVIDYDLCRFCVQCVKNNSCVSMDLLNETMALAKIVLPKCQPEMNLMSTKNLVVCMPCTERLERYLTFMKACWDVEEKIKQYCGAEGISGKDQMQLRDVLKTVINDGSESTQIGGIKIENSSECKDIRKTDISDRCTTKLEKEMLLFGDGERAQVGVIKIEHAFEDGENNETEIKDECVTKLEQELDIKQETELVEEWCSFDSLQHNEDPLASGIDCASGQGTASQIIVYQCEECSYKTNRKYSLKVHMLTHKNPLDLTLYKCEECPYRSKFKNHLKVHMLTHMDSSEVTMYKCELCTYKTKYKHYLKYHILKHKDTSEVTMHKCAMCTYTTKHRSSLKSHSLNHKDPSEVPLYKCEKCTYETKFKSNFQQHVKAHKGTLEVYNCAECPFKTYRKYSLKLHTLRHRDPSEVATYQCEQCTFRTKQKRNMRVHMLQHKDSSELTMYQCEECNYKTKFKHNLKGHILKHKNTSDITMYKCNMCTYITKRKSNLKAHMMTHRSVNCMPIK